MHLQILFVERSVDGTPLDPNDGCFTKGKDISHVERFLKDHEMAKIVIVIDTHSMPNGSLVWTGDSAEEYRTCNLSEVSRILRSLVYFASSCHHRFSGIACPKESISIYRMQTTRRSTTIGSSS
jgi:hypothetical protein